MVREIKLLKSLSHSKYVVKLLDIITPKNINCYKDLYIVMELVEADLKQVLKSSLNLSEKHIKVILYNILCSLKAIHQA